MRGWNGFALTIVLVASLTACSDPKDAPSAEDGGASADTAPSVADARPASFAMCSACHAVQGGSNGIGPSLAGVFGAKAGHLGDAYQYSDALKASGLVWDEATLDEWLISPSKKVPGTKMVYAGQPDPAKRKELIEYLKTLK